MSGAHAAIAAAKKKQDQDREEEALGGYNRDDLANWEFKIVRSTTSSFRKENVFYQTLEEEAVAGWELLEKLDDSRIRFKRPISARKNDPFLPEGINPYRTQIGITEGALGFILIS